MALPQLDIVLETTDITLGDPLPEGASKNDDGRPHWLWGLARESSNPPQRVWLKYPAEEVPAGFPVRVARAPKAGSSGVLIMGEPSVSPTRPTMSANDAAYGLLEAEISRLRLLAQLVGIQVPVAAAPAEKPSVARCPAVEPEQSRAPVEPVQAARHPEAETFIPPAPTIEVVALRVAAFAKRWSMSKREIETRIRRGLPLVGSGRARRVPIKEGDTWMREHGETPVEQRAREAARRFATKNGEAK